MIRLRNPDVSRIKEEALRFIRALGYDEPLPLYRRGVGEQYFATQDFADAMSLILDSIEGVEARYQLTRAGSEAMCDDKQSVETRSFPSVLDVVNR